MRLVCRKTLIDSMLDVIRAAAVNERLVIRASTVEKRRGGEFRPGGKIVPGGEGSVGGRTEVSQFVAQRLAVNPQDARRFGLVPVHIGQDVANVLSFNVRQRAVHAAFPKRGKAHQ